MKEHNDDIATSYLGLFDTLAPDLMGPSTFMFFDLLFVSVVHVKTDSPACRTKRSRNLITVIRLYHLWDMIFSEMSKGARSEIIGGARILVGLCQACKGIGGYGCR